MRIRCFCPVFSVHTLVCPILLNAVTWGYFYNFAQMSTPNLRNFIHTISLHQAKTSACTEELMDFDGQRLIMTTLNTSVEIPNWFYQFYSYPHNKRLCRLMEPVLYPCASKCVCLVEEQIVRHGGHSSSFNVLNLIVCFSCDSHCELSNENTPLYEKKLKLLYLCL